MTKRYLFVCGGAGKGLVDKRGTLGIDGLIQFDVASEMTILQHDKKTINFPIPVAGDTWLSFMQNINSRIDALNRAQESKQSELTRVISSYSQLIAKYEWLLEAQAAESSLYRELKAILDNLSTSVHERHDAEVRLATVATAVEEFTELTRQLRSAEAPYLPLMEEIASLSKIIMLSHSLARELAPKPIIDRQEPFPALTSVYFYRPIVHEHLDKTFAEMITQNPPSANESVEIYVVSSMCGSTGQGISQHVASAAAKYFRKKMPGAYISVRFIRFGAWTYNTIGAYRNFPKTNAAMAILHEAALAYRQTGMQDEQAAPITDESGVDFTNVEYRFYYLETPDVGGDKSLRMTDVEIACHAIMSEELSQTFQKVMVNIGPIDWFKGVLVRVGSWTNDIDYYQSFRETLEQLHTKIMQLVAPNKRLIVETLLFELHPNASLAKWLTAPFAQRRAPRILGSKLKRLTMGRFDDETVAEYLKSQAFSEGWARMTEFLDAYLGLHDKHDFAYDFHIGPKDPQTSLKRVAVDSQLASKGLGPVHLQRGTRTRGSGNGVTCVGWLGDR
ncbi:MAG: hypothetical protein RLZZ297_1978 [Chloroflexota bacterium]|jgi:hypothetical protein